MAKRLTRNICSIEDIERQPKYTNKQNDLLSDDKHVYVRNKNEYHNLTNSVKSVNDETIDENGNVEIDTGVHKVNGKRSDDKGNVEIDTGVHKVNGNGSDDQGNVEVDTGVMKVNGKDPDEQGNIEVDSGVKTVTNVAPDENGNVNLQIKDFKEQEKLVRKNQLDEALEDIELDYKNYFSLTAWKNTDDSFIVGKSMPAIKIELEGNTKYTLSTNVPKSGGYDDVFFATGDKDTGNTSSDGVHAGNPRTITTNDDGVATVAIRKNGMTSGDWWIMLNKGSTAYDWVPNANDIVTKQELDKKLDVELSGYATEDYVNQAIDEKAPDLSDYAKKEDVNTVKESLPKFENEDLVMTDTFENAFPDRKSTRLQYVLQGNMMQIFGLIRTKKELTGKSTYVVAKIPDKFSPIIEGYNYGTMGSRFHFKTYINEKNDPAYPNEITIRRITDVDNQYIDLSADENGVFHISLTIGVELNG